MCFPDHVDPNKRQADFEPYILIIMLRAQAQRSILYRLIY